MGPGHGNHSPSEDQLAELSRAYTIALLTGDEVAAEVTIREALDARLTKAEIDDQIIAPALWYVGELWQRGEITVADEHLATEISLRVLALHREAHRLTAHRRRATVMLAAPSGERHIVALEMVADLLRDAGYRVLMLGADVPSAALAVGRGASQAGRHRHERDDARRRRPDGDRRRRGAGALVRARASSSAAAR